MSTQQKFEREQRYLVVKLADAHQALSPEKFRALLDLGDKVTAARLTRGKTPLACVVVESDWPEYEETWRRIEARMMAATTPAGDAS